MQWYIELFNSEILSQNFLTFYCFPLLFQPHKFSNINLENKNSNQRFKGKNNIIKTLVLNLPVHI